MPGGRSNVALLPRIVGQTTLAISRLPAQGCAGINLELLSVNLDG